MAACRLHTEAMGNRLTVLATIGYEGADQADFIASLHAAAITRLIDVRELPISRRRGFAKSALSTALDEARIEYIHLRGLGDPKIGREAARSGDFVRFKKIFAAHMQSATARTDLAIASLLVSEGGACLMCYERDHSACHRTIVANAISDTLPLTIRHIGVRAGLAARNIATQTWEFTGQRP